MFQNKYSLLRLPVILSLLATQTMVRGAISVWDGYQADDSIEWDDLGSEGTVIGNPFTILSQGGTSLQVSMPTGDFERVDEGSGWTGNFAVGDKLLWTAFNDGPVVFEFQNGITGFGGGAQVQRDVLGDFTATFSAFDTLGNLIGSVDFPGTSNQNQDGSAIFAGIRSDAQDIKKISLEVTGPDEPDFKGFALNTLFLKTQAASIPDSSLSNLLIGSLLFSLLLFGARSQVSRT